MLQFLIVRSGTTEFDRQGRVLGNLDVPLHPDATRELEEIVDQLRETAIDAVYAGPGQSAVETAERVCKPLEMKFKSVVVLKIRLELIFRRNLHFSPRLSDVLNKSVIFLTN